jgi:hypothetical protein
MAAADPADAQVRSRQRAARGRFGAVWQGASAEHLAAFQRVTAVWRLSRRPPAGCGSPNEPNRDGARERQLRLRIHRAVCGAVHRNDEKGERASRAPDVAPASRR